MGLIDGGTLARSGEQVARASPRPKEAQGLACRAVGRRSTTLPVRFTSQHGGRRSAQGGQAAF